MKTIFIKELRRTRFSMMLWSAVAGLIIFFGMLEYPALAQLTESLGGLGSMQEALKAIPVAGQLVFGVYNVDLSYPIGYYIVMYYWVGLVVFTHAMYTGASIISKETRDKTAEFLFTKPYRRSIVVRAKMLAALINILVVGVVTILLSIVGMLLVTQDPEVYRQILTTGVGMLLTQCTLAAVGFICSALFKTYRIGMFAAMGSLILCYCLMFYVQYSGNPMLGFISPLAYFEISNTALHGLNAVFVLLAVALSAVCLLITIRLYDKKTMVV